MPVLRFGLREETKGKNWDWAIMLVSVNHCVTVDHKLMREMVSFDNCCSWCPNLTLTTGTVGSKSHKAFLFCRCITWKAIKNMSRQKKLRTCSWEEFDCPSKSVILHQWSGRFCRLCGLHGALLPLVCVFVSRILMYFLVDKCCTLTYSLFWSTRTEAVFVI